MLIYIFLMTFQVALADPMSNIAVNQQQSSMDGGVGEPPVLEPPSK